MLRLTYVKGDGKQRCVVCEPLRSLLLFLPSSFSRRVKLELTKAEKTGCLAGYQQASGLRSGVIGSTVFHFIAFETKNSRLNLL